jgi:hypothetical protein
MLGPPVERPLDLPHESGKRRRHLLLVRRDGGGAEDELEHLDPGALHGIGILGAEQGLGEVRVPEVDAVELPAELRQLRSRAWVQGPRGGQR